MFHFGFCCSLLPLKLALEFGKKGDKRWDETDVWKVSPNEMMNWWCVLCVWVTTSEISSTYNQGYKLHENITPDSTYLLFIFGAGVSSPYMLPLHLNWLILTQLIPDFCYYQASLKEGVSSVQNILLTWVSQSWQFPMSELWNTHLSKMFSNEETRHAISRLWEGLFILVSRPQGWVYQVT